MRPAWRMIVLALCAVLASERGTAQEKDNKKEEPKVITTQSGLKYQELKEGTGGTAKVTGPDLRSYLGLPDTWANFKRK